MKFGLEPIGHVAPMRRIDLNPKWTPRPEDELADICFSPAYCDHVWRVTRQTAEGTNVPDVAESF